MVYKPPAVSGVSKKEWRAYACPQVFASTDLTITTIAKAPTNPHNHNILHSTTFYHSFSRMVLTNRKQVVAHNKNFIFRQDFSESGHEEDHFSTKKSTPALL
ncbi:MAG TPA: hypothetical protein VH413_08530 [Verrucomicrobiae bacterium]|jgi:hypothetical protein|nr:hypothetical protein [Verrucomicrobiae bacterium]